MAVAVASSLQPLPGRLFTLWVVWSIHAASSGMRSPLELIFGPIGRLFYRLLLLLEQLNIFGLGILLDLVVL